MLLQLQLVDLAGCEQLKKSKVEGHAKREAVAINRSLLALGRVINALVEVKPHGIFVFGFYLDFIFIIF